MTISFFNNKSTINRKVIIGLLVITVLAIAILTVPDLLGLNLSLSLQLLSIVLVSVYVVLAFEMVHRMVIVLVGATIAIIIGITTGLFSATDSFEFAVHSIDFNTIGLLLGMMIIVVILAETGIFQYVGLKMFKISKGNMWKLLIVMTVFTAVASMFIDNVTTILLMLPVTFSIFRVLNVSPIPFVLAQTLSSNVGGTATLIGDPPNIMIGSAVNIDFNSFLIHLGPAIAVSFLVSLVMFRLFFRKELKVEPQNLEALMTQDERPLIKDRPLLKKSLFVLFSVIVLFVIHGNLHIEPSIIALGGAGILFLISKSKPEKIFHDVDWTTLVFFAGLFIIISVGEESGMISLLAKTAINITGGDPWITFFLIIWLGAIASSFVDNIPFTATMIPLTAILIQDSSIIAGFGELPINPLWWAIALGVGLGGNGTLIGSSAGVIATGLSEKHGHTITYNRFFKVGFPFMICTVAVGSIVLMIDTWLRLNLL
ncbi:MAG: ArsB/NhaD family transporter [Nitrosopumilaceae archaeon]